MSTLLLGEYLINYLMEPALATQKWGLIKYFTELGYPGELKGYNTGKSAVEYGDLQMYHAYCGNYIVLLSRAYIDIDVNSPYCIKVVDKMTLNDAGSLNIGSISLTNIKMITSDYRGSVCGSSSD